MEPDSTNEHRVYGPPGCGKTTFLTRQIRRAVEKFGESSILVASFTKAAAAELAGRDLPLNRNQIGTLHSHCYRAIGSPELVSVDAWNSQNPAYRLTGEATADDDGITEAHGATDADTLFNKYNVLRNRMRPRELWPYEVRMFAERWERFKRESDSVDFCDMIERATVECEGFPGDPQIVFIDEAQDMSSMEWGCVRKWSHKAERLIVAGDDDQCSLPGTMVLTTRGEVPIEKLDPDIHRVVSYDRPSSFVVGFKDGYEFQKAQRWYTGKVATVSAGGKFTSCTADHLWLARWTKEIQYSKTCVVYMMRQGNRFRIGWCQLFNVEGTFHLGSRSRNEKADGAWILRVCEDRSEASIYESYYATKYGLPLVTFEPAEGSNHYTKEWLDRFFEMLGEEVIRARAEMCLKDFGLEIKYPLWTTEKAYKQRGGSSLFLVETCNLIPGIMAIPILNDKRGADWQPLAVSWKDYEGPVYSMNVEKYHMYIADGLITHNCLYHFKGADYAQFLTPIPDSQKTVLSQSYRVPRAVQAVAEQWVKTLKRREPKEYKPRDFEGEVRHLKGATFQAPELALKDAEKYLSEGKTVMFLTTCSYMLDPLKALLRSEGIPFHNPYRRSRHDWNPLFSESKTSSKERLLAFLRPQGEVWGEDARLWNIDDLRMFTALLKTKDALMPGAKKLIENFSIKDRGFGELDINQDLIPWLGPGNLYEAMEGNLDWFEYCLLAAKKKPMEYLLRIARQRGGQALRNDPQVVIGTMHSTKGGECDRVYIFPDLSMSAMEEWQGMGEARESIIRLFYVGMTRAKEGLIFCDPSTGLYPTELEKLWCKL